MTTSLSRLFLLCLLAALLAGCGSVPTVPETTYYRLPDAAPVTRLAEPAMQLPIVVDRFAADGLYSDQALIYSMDADASRLRTYHYQLWIDPPVRLLQRRLIANLRNTGVSRIVTDRLPVQIETVRVRGRIARLERVRTASGWEVAVTLVLRADPHRGGKPWVIGEYHRQLPATGERVLDSVHAFGAAVDAIYAEFAQQLIEYAQQGGHGPTSDRPVEMTGEAE